MQAHCTSVYQAVTLELISTCSEARKWIASTDLYHNWRHPFNFGISVVWIRIRSGSMHYFFQVPHKQKSNRLTEREAILIKQLTWVQLQILKPWNQRSSTEALRRLALNHYMFCLCKSSFGTSDSSIILTVSKGEWRSSLSSRPFTAQCLEKQTVIMANGIAANRNDLLCSFRTVLRWCD